MKNETILKMAGMAAIAIIAVVIIMFVISGISNFFGGPGGGSLLDGLLDTWMDFSFMPMERMFDLGFSVFDRVTERVPFGTIGKGLETGGEFVIDDVGDYFKDDAKDDAKDVGKGIKDTGKNIGKKIGKWF